MRQSDFFRVFVIREGKRFGFIYVNVIVRIPIPNTCDILNDDDLCIPHNHNHQVIFFAVICIHKLAVQNRRNVGRFQNGDRQRAANVCRYSGRDRDYVFACNIGRELVRAFYVRKRSCRARFGLVGNRNRCRRVCIFVCTNLEREVCVGIDLRRRCLTIVCIRIDFRRCGKGSRHFDRLRHERRFKRHGVFACRVSRHVNFFGIRAYVNVNICRFYTVSVNNNCLESIQRQICVFGNIREVQNFRRTNGRRDFAYFFAVSIRQLVRSSKQFFRYVRLFERFTGDLFNCKRIRTIGIFRIDRHIRFFFIAFGHIRIDADIYFAHNVIVVQCKRNGNFVLPVRIVRARQLERIITVFHYFFFRFGQAVESRHEFFYAVVGIIIIQQRFERITVHHFDAHIIVILAHAVTFVLQTENLIFAIRSKPLLIERVAIIVISVFKDIRIVRIKFVIYVVCRFRAEVIEITFHLTARDFVPSRNAKFECFCHRANVGIGYVRAANGAIA